MPVPIIMAALEAAEAIAATEAATAIEVNVARAAKMAQNVDRLAKIAEKGLRTARAPKAADELRNARRRFAREADRYIKEANKYTGAVKDRYETLAKRSLNKALSTYSENYPASKYSKDIKNLIDNLDSSTLSKVRRGDVQGLIKESFSSLQSADIDRRAEEADRIMSSSAGSRIYGATTNIWAKVGEDGKLTDRYSYRERNKALMDYFGVDDMMGVIEKFEEEFPDTLYGDTDKLEKYDEIVTAGLARFK